MLFLASGFLGHSCADIPDEVCLNLSDMQVNTDFSGPVVDADLLACAQATLQSQSLALDEVRSEWSKLSGSRSSPSDSTTSIPSAASRRPRKLTAPQKNKKKG